MALCVEAAEVFSVPDSQFFHFRITGLIDGCVSIVHTGFDQQTYRFLIPQDVFMEFCSVVKAIDPGGENEDEFYVCGEVQSAIDSSSWVYVITYSDEQSRQNGEPDWSLEFSQKFGFDFGLMLCKPERKKLMRIADQLHEFVLNLAGKDE